MLGYYYYYLSTTGSGLGGRGGGKEEGTPAVGGWTGPGKEGPTHWPVAHKFKMDLGRALLHARLGDGGKKRETEKRP